MSVQIRGLKETQRAMEQMVRDLDGHPMARGMRQATLMVQRDAKAFAPVDTGRLRASITPEVDRRGNELVGIVGSIVRHAPFMELGTGVFAGNPRHRMPPPEALDTWARRHGIPSGFLVARAIANRGGLRPRRYLQRALERNAVAIFKLLGNTVGRIVA